MNKISSTKSGGADHKNEIFDVPSEQLLEEMSSKEDGWIARMDGLLESVLNFLTSVGEELVAAVKTSLLWIWDSRSPIIGFLSILVVLVGLYLTARILWNHFRKQNRERQRYYIVPTKNESHDLETLQHLKEDNYANVPIKY